MAHRVGSGHWRARSRCRDADGGIAVVGPGWGWGHGAGRGHQGMMALMESRGPQGNRARAGQGRGPGECLPW